MLITKGEIVITKEEPFKQNLYILNGLDTDKATITEIEQAEGYVASLEDGVISIYEFVPNSLKYEMVDSGKEWEHTISFDM